MLGFINCIGSDPTREVGIELLVHVPKLKDLAMYLYHTTGVYEGLLKELRKPLIPLDPRIPNFTHYALRLLNMIVNEPRLASKFMDGDQPGEILSTVGGKKEWYSDSYLEPAVIKILSAEIKNPQEVVTPGFIDTCHVCLSVALLPTNDLTKIDRGMTKLAEILDSKDALEFICGTPMFTEWFVKALVDARKYLMENLILSHKILPKVASCHIKLARDQRAKPFMIKLISPDIMILVDDYLRYCDK
ncbi:uncharacterized protein LOC126266450 isoform X2 [Aethina tumida]|nr:uncharacterized protein LOC126266450 isoform X2 [Aethina tumida]